MNRVTTRPNIPGRGNIPDPALIPGWTILPLRIFLGASFVSAGLDKLTDPAFLDPSARNYIGNQIALFAPGTPLEGFLTNVAIPNATLFGLLVMGGELMIGLAVLMGALTRFSAVMGMFINLTFFLSATWEVHPFYFGADLPYAVAWLTLALTGPGPLALDLLVKQWLDGRAPWESPASGTTVGEKAFTRRALLSAGAGGLTVAGIAATGLAWMLLHPKPPTGTASAASPTATPEAPSAGKPPAVAAPHEGPTPPEQPTDTPQPAQVSQPPEPAATDTPAPIPTDAAAAADTGGKQLLAAPGDLPQGQAAEFQLPTGETAVLVHNGAGYSAYVAICTHEGCQVRPVVGGLLACPCHGAEFDPNQSGRAVRGPARRPLSAVAITVGPDGSVYLDE